MSNKEDNVKELKEKLFLKRENGGKSISKDDLEKSFAFAEEYKDFLNKSKTEKESVRYALKCAAENGFEEFDKNKKYKLCYLYYCVASDEMKKHSEELEDFQKHLDDCINFKAMSYQEFFSKLKLKMQEHGKYLDYMKDRYNL